MNGFIFCPKCREVKAGTRHHVFPKRHFNDCTILHICRKCHDKLERLIPFKKKTKDFYIRITQQFIGGKHVKNMYQTPDNMSRKRRTNTKKI